jgi:hypothetical protein
MKDAMLEILFWLGVPLAIFVLLAIWGGLIFVVINEIAHFNDPPTDEES